MKKVNCIILVLAAIIVIACSKPETVVNDYPLQGAWNLIYAQYISNDTVVATFPGIYSGSGIKIWSKEYVVYVARYKKDTTDMDGYGGGPYKLNGNRYEETIQFFSVQSYVGNNVKMLMEIKNDTLIQTFPVDDNGQIDKSNYRIEKRVRLD